MTEADFVGGWPARGLLAAVLIQALCIGFIGAHPGYPERAPSYRTLSEPAEAPTVGTIRVVPDSSMALTDWNALLHVLKLRVVGGPDHMGAYTVAPMDGTSATSHTLQRLRAVRGVRWAQPVAAAP